MSTKPPRLLSLIGVSFKAGTTSAALGARLHSLKHPTSAHTSDRLHRHFSMSEKVSEIVTPTQDDIDKIKKALEEKVKVWKSIDNILKDGVRGTGEQRQAGSKEQEDKQSIEDGTKIKARLEAICDILQQRLNEQSSNAAGGSS